MMHGLLGIVIATTLAGCVGWTHADTVGELAFIAAASLDEGQTQEITRHCAESNPIIGPCGQHFGPYWPMTYALHAVVSAVLPPGARTWWQALTVGGELATVWKNHGDGISF